MSKNEVDPQNHRGLSSFFELEENALREDFSSIVGEQVDTISYSQPLRGFSGKVLIVNIGCEGNFEHSFVLKQTPSIEECRFYQEALPRYRLNHPQVLGVIGERYVCLEFVKHEKLDKQDWDQARVSIDWLVYKDQLMMDHVSALAKEELISSELWFPIDEWIETLEKGVGQNVHDLLTQKFLLKIRKHKPLYDLIPERLSKELITVSHNDYNFSNIARNLDSLDQRVNLDNLIVLDWSGPSATSVAVDLVRMCSSAIPEHREKMLKTYFERMQLDIDKHRDLLNLAEIRMHLDVLRWGVERALVGRKHDLPERKWPQCINGIMKGFE